MTATEFPKFDGFAITVTKEEVEKAKAGDRLQAGDREMEIVSVEYKGTVAKDPSWLQFNLYLHNPGTQPEADGKFKGAVKMNLMVPTKDLKYNDKLGVFFMLVSFLDGLGEELTIENANEIIPKYFSDVQKTLLGRKLNVTIGYKGPHVAYKDHKFFLADKDGKALVIAGVPNSFANRESAEGQAMISGIDIGRTAPDGRFFTNKLEVLRVHAGEKQPEVKSTKVSASW